MHSPLGAFFNSIESIGPYFEKISKTSFGVQVFERFFTNKFVFNFNLSLFLEDLNGSALII